MTGVTDLSVERMLSSGGDQRLSLQGPDRLNAYGCAFRPLDRVSFSSCTASTISESAFDWVKSLMVRDEGHRVDWKARFQSLRDQLRAILGLEDDVDIALGPSGTDLEALATLACVTKYGPLTNIVVAPDEIGSGSLLAASGKHFGETAPLAGQVEKGAWIEGFEALDVQVEPVAVRDADTGEVLPESVLKETLHQRVDEAVGRGRTVLLHLVYMSKTGLVSPSLNTVHELKKTHGESVRVIVDCCQGRISRDDINRLLEQQFLVLFTGSKFYSGPPFSGALFLPKSLAAVYRRTSRIPSGLADYFSRAEFPLQWKAFDGVLPEQANLGLYYRWEAALHELTLFHRTNPRKFAQTARIFDEVFKQAVEESGVLKHISPSVEGEPVDDFSQFLLRSIKTVELKVAGLTFEGAKALHQRLASDEGGRFHLGQPVKVCRLASGDWVPVLRFALGAPFFVTYAGRVESVQRRDLLDQLRRTISQLRAHCEL